jgi:hypothetical protein
MAIFRGAGGPGDATTDAANEASVASTKAAEAEASATAAASSATSASNSATTAINSKDAAATSESNAATSALAASTSEANAANSETNASDSESNAATSETNAANSASSALTSKNAAAISEANASTSETNASASASAASTSAASAAASYDGFDDRYLGAKSTDPTVDNDNDLLITGALYFNTTSNDMKVYNGSAWEVTFATLSGALAAANNLSDVVDVASSRTNLGLGSTDSPSFAGLTVASDSTYAIDVSRPSAGNTTARITGGASAGNDVVFRADIGNTTGTSAVYFGDTDTNGIGRIMYEHNGDFMRFYTSSTEKMRIESAGNVGIGTASPAEKLDVSGNIAVTGTVDGRDVATDGTKLDGIETGATADQTAGEIKTAYESNADTNAFTDAEQTKLAGIETSADVTDTTNVTAAGAVMDSELTSEASVKALDQGVATTDSPSFAGLTVASDSSYAIDVSRPSAGNTTLRITGGSTAGNDAIFRADIANTTGTSAIYFGDSDTNGIGRIMYEHTGDYMRFYTSSTEKMRITSAGNVGIGTSNPTSKLDVLGNITVSGTVDGRDVATDGTKLDGIEASATADQSAAEIKTAYESNVNTNAFTDAEQEKLSGVDTDVEYAVNAAQIALSVSQAITNQNVTQMITPQPSLYFQATDGGGNPSGSDFARADAANRINSVGLLESVSSGNIRFDYDPTTLAARGWLKEPARTNSLPYSQDLSNAQWVKANCTITTNQGTDAAGAVTLDKMVENAGSGAKFIREVITADPTLVWTQSAIVKAAGRSVVQLYADSGTAANGSVLADFDLANGTVLRTSTANGGVIHEAKIVYHAAIDAYRISLCATSSTAGSAVRIQLYMSDTDANGSASYTGNGSSGVLAGNFQLEQGYGATSIIDTSGTTVSRAADDFDYDVSASTWYNESQGTVYVEFECATNTIPDVGLISINDDSLDDAITVSALDDNSGTVNLKITDGTVDVFDENDIETITGSISRACVGWSNGSQVGSVNGVLSSESTSSTLPSTATQIEFGQKAGNNYMFGWIKQIAVWAIKLSDSEQQIITKPGAFATFDNEDLQILNNTAKNAGNELRNRKRTGLLGLTKERMMVLGLGQSLEFSASATIPVLTTTALSNSLMMGNSVRPVGEADVFDPIGTDQFNPIIATADNVGIIVDVTADSWSTSLSGECPVVSECHMLKNFFDDFQQNLTESTDRALVGAVAAKGQALLADISLITGDDFLRAVDAGTVMKSLSDSGSFSSGMPLISMGHGEADTNANTAKATYKTGFAQYLDDLHTYISVGVFGQDGYNRALTVAHVNGKRWSDDAMNIPSAMLELETERDDLVLAVPTYACQNTHATADQHLTANGARFKGLKHAQAAKEVLLYKRNFFIPRIEKAWWRGKEIVIGYAAMHYPIQFKNIWDNSGSSVDRVDLTNKGFTVSDSGGAITIISVEIPSGQDALVKITLDREPTDTPTILYAGETTYAGRGNVCDSDPTKSPLNYEEIDYVGTADVAAGVVKADYNIVGLVDNPYDMENFAIPQKVTATIF